MQGVDTTEGFIIDNGRVPIGYIQRYRLAGEHEWRRTIAGAVNIPDEAAGIDYLIGEAAVIGRGLGSEAISAFVAELWKGFVDVTGVVVAVQQLNLPSWHALESAGFQRIWTGTLDTDDPSDQGPAYLYFRSRPPN